MTNKFTKPNPEKQLFDSHSFHNGEMYKHMKTVWQENPAEYLELLARIIRSKTVPGKHRLEDDYSIYCDEWNTEYRINPQGCRSKLFRDIWDKPVIVAVGCSITMGVGLDLTDTWIYKLAKQLGYQFVNCAMPGSSTTITSLYTAEYILNEFTDVKGVFCYTPPPNRIDLLCYTDLNEAQYHIKDQDITTDNLLNWLDRDLTRDPLNYLDDVVLRSIEHTSFLNYTKDNLLLKYACERQNIPYTQLDSEIYYESQHERWPEYKANMARDGLHDGADLHTDIATSFLDIFCDK